jgi:gamma-glutamyltranspeptidase/glutathione hydrolase
MSVGAPGGTRIISCVAQTLLNYLEFKMPPYESIASPRYHHQWLPDELDLEPGKIPSATIEKLKLLGHNVQEKAINCNVMSVMKEGNLFRAVSDPRDIGTSMAR